MKTLVMIMLVLLVGLAVGCEQLAQVQDEDVTAVQATPMPPATPGQPKEAGESGARPSTPSPAATPQPADTPMSVTTPIAVLPSYTPEPTATVAPRPTAMPTDGPSAKEQREEFIARCKHWALRNFEPIEYSRFEELDPYNMSDLERVLWGSVIVGQDQVGSISAYYSNSVDNGDFRFRNDQVEWCQDYWSEPLSQENAGKRNHPAWQISCQADLSGDAWELEERVEYAFEEYESEGMSAVIVNQYARILNWVDIDGDTLLTIDPKPRDIVRMVWDREDDGPSRYRERNRISDWPLSSSKAEDIEWWHIESVWQADWEECKSYYPQLFFGRWVPLDDFRADEWLEEAQERLEEQRERDDWPEWADGPDRDILIHLE